MIAYETMTAALSALLTQVEAQAARIRRAVSGEHVPPPMALARCFVDVDAAASTLRRHADRLRPTASRAGGADRPT
jgi:hypothetical protein